MCVHDVCDCTGAQKRDGMGQKVSDPRKLIRKSIKYKSVPRSKKYIINVTCTGIQELLHNIDASYFFLMDTQCKY